MFMDPVDKVKRHYDYQIGCMIATVPRCGKQFPQIT